MKDIFPVLALLAVCGCQQEVAVPTAQELIDNRQMLATWQSKCDSGEYSHLKANAKARKCSTTHDATISVTQAAEGKKASDFFKANTIRK